MTVDTSTPQTAPLRAVQEPVRDQEPLEADGPGEEVWVVNFTCFRMEEVSLVEDITAVDPDAHVTLSDITNQPGSPDLDLTVQRVSLRVAPLRLAAVATVPAVTIAVMTTPPNLASSAVPPYQASLLSTRDCTAT